MNITGHLDDILQVTKCADRVDNDFFLSRLKVFVSTGLDNKDNSHIIVVALCL